MCGYKNKFIYLFYQQAIRVIELADGWWQSCSADKQSADTQDYPKLGFCQKTFFWRSLMLNKIWNKIKTKQLKHEYVYTEMEKAYKIAHTKTLNLKN